MSNTHGTHDHQDDPRDASILIGLNGENVPRAEAMVSVFDSGDIGLTRDQLAERIMDTLAANDMGPGTDGEHIRLMITRGMQSTPYQDPRFTITPPTIVIIPEYKDPRPETPTNGIRLATVSVRRGRPDVQDPRCGPRPATTACPASPGRTCCGCVDGRGSSSERRTSA